MWQVQVLDSSGSPAVQLCKHAPSDGFEFLEDEEHGCVLTAKRFTALQTALEVRDAARAILELVDGALALTKGKPMGLRPGGVYKLRDDGRRDVNVFPTGIAVSVMTGAVGVSIKDRHGETAHEAVHPGQRMVHAANANPTFSRALRLYSKEQDWVALYRVFDAIRDGFKETELVDKGWVTKADLKSFRHTANSWHVLGSESRHGSTRELPPDKPMPLPEAQSLIRTLLERWAREISANMY